jgi:hypothetical protein
MSTSWDGVWFWPGGKMMEAMAIVVRPTRVRIELRSFIMVSVVV